MDELKQIEESFDNQMNEAMQMLFSEPSQYMTLGEITFENCHIIAKWWLDNNPIIAKALAEEILAQGENT